MAAYKVRINGEGGLGRERKGWFGRTEFRPIGFFTTRFVMAPDEQSAAQKALTLVRKDADPLTEPHAPWTLTAVSVEQVAETLVQEVRGFTFL
jgi:hypothetical protein